MDNRKRVVAVNANHAPAAAAQATATIAAPGTSRYIHVTEISASFAAGATAGTPVQLVLRDGASGAGTILRQWSLAAPANGFAAIVLTGIDIPMSANTAATLEFTGAGAASTEERVNITGYVSDQAAAQLR